jgi:spoIIIJ-associated protein
MTDNRSMTDAIDQYVEDLKEEQKNNRLMENSSKHIDTEEFEAEEEIIDQEGISELSVILERILTRVCECQDIIIEVDKDRDRLSAYGSDLKSAIGKNGKNIEAIEHILNLIGKRKKLIKRTVSIDIKDYKKKKVDEIKKIALKMARKAKSEGKKIMLRPMKSYERKIIHDVLSEDDTVRTVSKNKEPFRRITIYPVK